MKRVRVAYAMPFFAILAMLLVAPRLLNAMWQEVEAHRLAEGERAAYVPPGFQLPDELRARQERYNQQLAFYKDARARHESLSPLKQQRELARLIEIFNTTQAMQENLSRAMEEFRAGTRARAGAWTRMTLEAREAARNEQQERWQQQRPADRRPAAWEARPEDSREADTLLAMANRSAAQEQRLMQLLSQLGRKGDLTRVWRARYPQQAPSAAPARQAGPTPAERQTEEESRALAAQLRQNIASRLGGVTTWEEIERMSPEDLAQIVYPRDMQSSFTNDVALIKANLAQLASGNPIEDARDLQQLREAINRACWAVRNR